MVKNLADDCSFEDLGRMIREFTYLERGIESRQKKKDELFKKIVSESKRLKEIGYDLKDLDITLIEGKEI